MVVDSYYTNSEKIIYKIYIYFCDRGGGGFIPFGGGGGGLEPPEALVRFEGGGGGSCLPILPEGGGGGGLFARAMEGGGGGFDKVDGICKPGGALSPAGALSPDGPSNLALLESPPLGNVVDEFLKELIKLSAVWYALLLSLLLLKLSLWLLL